jgi:hypothetical protein
MVCERLRSLISRPPEQRVQVFGNVQDSGGNFQETRHRQGTGNVAKREDDSPLGPSLPAHPLSKPY